MLAKMKNHIAMICTTLLVTATVAAGAPVIKNFSSTGGQTQNKSGPKDTMYLVKQGDRITFSITTAKACEHGWSIRKGSRVLAAQTRKDTKHSTFKWKVPDEKANWDIEVSAYGKIRKTGPTPRKAQKIWNITTSTIKTVKPGQSIQKAIDALGPMGGIVELAEGIFDVTGKIPIVIKKNNTAVIGQGMEKTELVCSGFPPGPVNALFYAVDVKDIGIEKMYVHSTVPNGASIKTNLAIHLRRVSNVVISRVKVSHFRGGLQTNFGDNEKSWNVNNLTVSDCIFTKNYCGSGNVFTINSKFLRNTFSYSASHCGLEFNGGCDNNIIEGNIAHHNQYGFKFYVGNDKNIWRNNTAYSNWAGIFGQHAGWDNRIINNLFYNNSHYGIAIDGPHPYTVFVESNTIVSNGVGGIYCGGKYSIDVKNNIIVNNKSYGIEGAKIRSTHNNVWGNKKGNYRGIKKGKDDMSLDPLFADPAKGDFHLKSKAGRWDPKTKKWIKDTIDSPCIDAGDPKTDCSKELAPNGGRVNMGTYGNTGQASKSATQQKGRTGEIMSKKKQTNPQTHALAKRLEEHLEKNILSFLLRHSPDKEYGGFVTQLDRQGKWYGRRTKRLVPQTRMVWTFASAHRAGLGGGKYLQAARDGFPFLLKYMWDEKEGGWYWSVTRKGKPGSTRKRIYAQAFGIYGPCEYYFAAGDKEALGKAEKTFDLLEKHAYDKKHGGYFTGNFTRDWKREGSTNRSAGTHLHLVESLVSLVRATGKEKYRKRLKELLDILVDKLFLPKYGCNVEVYTEDWKPIIESDTLYVHDLEAAWLIIDAAKALGLKDKKYLERACNLVDYSLKYAWDEKHGGFFQKGAPGKLATDTKKNYNVQGEGLVALATLYRETRDKKYFQKLKEHAKWCLEVQADSKYGEWFTMCTAGGKPTMIEKAGLWKAGYHHPRGCLYAAKILERMKRSK